MAYAQEIRLDDLPDDVDGHVSQLLALWQGACRDGDIPDRHDLSSDILAPWRDDIGIYEYQPDRNDFGGLSDPVRGDQNRAGTNSHDRG